MAVELMERYAALERMMLEADERGDETFADALRDLMDPIWYGLSDEEHEILNGRGALSLTTLYPVTISLSRDMKYSLPPNESARYVKRWEPVEITGWRMEVT